MSAVLIQKKGLTLVEVIVALAVIIMGVVAGLTLTVYNLKASLYGEHQLVAANLAREGLEAVRARRDSNWLSGEEWNKDIFAAGETNFSPSFNPVDGSWSMEPADNADVDECVNCRLYLDQASGVYSLDNSKTRTIFSRLLSIKEICWVAGVFEEAVRETGETCAEVNQELIGWEITSIVSFDAYGKETETEVVDRLYNWR